MGKWTQQKYDDELLVKMKGMINHALQEANKEPRRPRMSYEQFVVLLDEENMGVLGLMRSVIDNAAKQLTVSARPNNGLAMPEPFRPSTSSTTRDRLRRSTLPSLPPTASRPSATRQRNREYTNMIRRIRSQTGSTPSASARRRDEVLTGTMDGEGRIEYRYESEGSISETSDSDEEGYPDGFRRRRGRDGGERHEEYVWEVSPAEGEEMSIPLRERLRMREERSTLRERLEAVRSTEDNGASTSNEVNRLAELASTRWNDPDVVVTMERGEGDTWMTGQEPQRVEPSVQGRRSRPRRQRRLLVDELDDFVEDFGNEDSEEAIAEMDRQQLGINIPMVIDLPRAVINDTEGAWEEEVAAIQQARLGEGEDNLNEQLTTLGQQVMRASTRNEEILDRQENDEQARVVGARLHRSRSIRRRPTIRSSSRVYPSISGAITTPLVAEPSSISSYPRWTPVDSSNADEIVFPDWTQDHNPPSEFADLPTIVNGEPWHPAPPMPRMEIPEIPSRSTSRSRSPATVVMGGVGPSRIVPDVVDGTDGPQVVEMESEDLVASLDFPPSPVGEEVSSQGFEAIAETSRAGSMQSRTAEFERATARARIRQRTEDEERGGRVSVERVIAENAESIQAAQETLERQARELLDATRATQVAVQDLLDGTRPLVG